ncbi:MAG: DUF1565 domain-containing protein [Clostridia bacterium]|nr:DUF1565 domain-containing protein [Clostridia bacterium]
MLKSLFIKGFFTKAVSLIVIFALVLTLSNFNAMVGYAAGITYYVSTSGNDNNNGTSPSSPFRTIKKACTVAGAGDIVTVADGTYNEDEIIIENKYGSDTNRFILKSTNKWGAKIVSNSVWNAITVKDSVGVTIEGLDVSFKANTTSIYFGILTLNCDLVSILNNKVHDCPCSGIQPNNSDNVLVQGNYVYNNAKTSHFNGSGISVYEPIAKSASSSGFGIIIRGNYVYDNVCNVADPNIGIITDGNGIILDDFRWTQNTGTPYTKGALVENNVVYRNGGRGIHVFESDNVTVRNNTIWHNLYKLGAGSNFDWTGDLNFDSASGCIAANNIVVRDPSVPYGKALYDDSAPTKTKTYNNIIVGAYLLQNGNTLTSGNQTSTTDTYPKFVSPGTDFRLQSSSPAINAGYNSNASAHDIQGVCRPIASTVDIGCYEYFSAAATVNFEDRPDTVSALKGSYGGIDWGQSDWNTDLSYGSRSAWTASSGARTITLPSNSVLNSLKLRANGTASVQLSSTGNTTKTFNPTSSWAVYSTGWTAASQTVTVTISGDVNFDDFVYAPVSLQNIAPNGTGYTWSNNSAATSNSNRAANSAVNDNNTSTTANCASCGGVSNLWHGAGVVFSTAQSNITKVEFVNATVSGVGQDGNFEANCKLQFSTDGTTWTDSNWTISPSYPNNYTASNNTYTFTGSAVNNIRGVRVVGQVMVTGGDGSWYFATKEFRIFK